MEEPVTGWSVQDPGGRGNPEDIHTGVRIVDDLLHLVKSPVDVLSRVRSVGSTTKFPSAPRDRPTRLSTRGAVGDAQDQVRIPAIVRHQPPSLTKAVLSSRT